MIAGKSYDYLFENTVIPNPLPGFVVRQTADRFPEQDPRFWFDMALFVTFDFTGPRNPFPIFRSFDYDTSYGIYEVTVLRCTYSHEIDGGVIGAIYTRR
jgi:hypothetical protein